MVKSFGVRVRNQINLLAFPKRSLAVVDHPEQIRPGSFHIRVIFAPQSHEMGASEALISIVTDPPLDILTGRHDGSLNIPS